MSQVNIKRAVENIRANTTVYAPIVEVVVNAIQAIESTGKQDGRIAVRIHRADQMEIDGGLPDVQSFDVQDNGVGFTAANRQSFDTLYSDLKIAAGGKGFGRFICLKYFEDVQIESIFADGKAFKRREFSMGKETDIIVNEKITASSQKTSGTVVHLKRLKDGKSIDKKLNTIARNLVEKLLPSFLSDGYACPEVILSEADVAAILVREGSGKPYIVSKMTDEVGKTVGAHFGYFERKQDVIPSITVERIQQQLAAGQQWGSIDQRLQAIESSMSAWAKPGPPKRTALLITDAERVSRLKAARVAVGRDDAPLVYYTASPEGECDFPTLLRSRGERVVRLIEKPPQLRPQGFEIWAGDGSEILQGKMRRNMLSGSRLIELWKDGVFIFIAPGDEDFLGWRMHGFDKPIHISNFVLAESVPSGSNM